MTRPVVFRRRAQSDLIAAYDWYETQHAALGEELLSVIQATTERIAAFPEMFGTIREDVRRVLVPRFPFAMFYLIESHRVVVLRVLHTARDPTLWPRSKRKQH